MPRTPRQFCASIGVRFDTRRTKIELSPAPLHGGPEGQFRVRVNRRWMDAPEGGHLFFTEAGLAHLAARLAFGSDPESSTMPVIPPKTRVSVVIDEDGATRHEQGFTLAPPMQALDGRVYVALFCYSLGAVMHPVDALIIRGQS